MTVGSGKIPDSTTEKRLGVTLDREPEFQTHINEPCKNSQ